MPGIQEPESDSITAEPSFQHRPLSAEEGESQAGDQPDDEREGITRRDFIKQVGSAAGAAAALPLLTGTGSANQVHAQTDNPIRIGVLLAYSGIYATVGENITRGMELYFDQIGWEAGGRSIELVQEDTEADPGVALSRARRLVEQEQVDLLTGIVSSGVLLALRDYVHAQQIPLICSNAGAPQLSRNRMTPYVWRTSYTNWQPPYPLGSWNANNLGTQGMISVHDYAAGHDVRNSISHSFTENGGEILAVQQPPFPDMGDPAPFMSTIQEVDPDLVMVFYGGSAAVAFVNAYDEFGLKGEIPLTGSGFFTMEEVLPAMGSSAEGHIGGLHWAWGLDTPANNEFKEQFREHTGQEANFTGMQGFDTARVIAEMMDELGGDTSSVDQMIEVLPTVSFTSPRGPFTLDKDTQAPKQHIYIREVREVNGRYHNIPIEDTGPIVDPGDDSLEYNPT